MKVKYIYRISQTKVSGDNTYDSAVVIAENEKEARETHPNESLNPWGSITWCASPDDVTVELIGIAGDNQLKGVVCVSFNAG